MPTDLTDRGARAGRHREELFAAIIAVAENTALALDAKAKTVVDIRLLKLMTKK
jgi:hypothetical protein